MMQLRRGLAAVAILVFSTACAALPDASPFASATTDLASAVKASGEAVDATLRDAPGVRAQADQLKKDWAARVRAMDAMVRYADSLAALVKAGTTGHDAAEAVGKELGGLAQALGVTPPGEAVAVVTDIASFVWGQIALAKAASELEDALRAAQPAVVALAQHLGDDFRDLDLAVRAAGKLVEGALTADPDFVAARDAGAKAATAKQAVFSGVAASPDLSSASRRAALSTDLGAIQQYDALIASSAAATAPVRDKLDALGKQTKATRALIAGAAETTERWAVAHRDLILAVQNRRPVDVHSLTDAVVELRRLINEVKKL